MSLPDASGYLVHPDERPRQADEENRLQVWNEENQVPQKNRVLHLTDRSNALVIPETAIWCLTLTKPATADANTT